MKKIVIFDTLSELVYCNIKNYWSVSLTDNVKDYLYFDSIEDAQYELNNIKKYATDYLYDEDDLEIKNIYLVVGYVYINVNFEEVSQ
jgi:hypothetical protein